LEKVQKKISQNGGKICVIYYGRIRKKNSPTIQIQANSAMFAANSPMSRVKSPQLPIYKAMYPGYTVIYNSIYALW